MTRPIVYLAFANDPSAPLPMLTEEAQQLERIFRRVSDTHIQLEKDEFATLDIIAEKLRHFGEKLQVFHYAGHADGQKLLLPDGAADGGGMARLILAANPRLVFLNGCSTRGQVQRLLELGAPVVIATSRPVADQMATEVAAYFFQSLCSGMSINAAFQAVEGYFAAKGQSTLLSRVRSISLSEVETDAGAMPWGLYYEQESALDWALPKAQEPEKMIQQSAEKIYNIGKIDQADFS
ncbi:MAG: CHAT domain-containing protein [Lewinellaceae bacterium]|nr:CHAT domain-containing protein [Lewinellaceae bacterium]